MIEERGYMRMALRVDEQRVRARMVECRIYSVEELARRSDVTSSTLRRMFAGEEFLSTSLTKIATALNCSPFDLLTAEGHPDPLLAAPALATVAA